MKTLGYYNGKISELEEMQVPMLDRACYFGDGIYDTALAYNKKIFALDSHITRFFNNAEALNFNMPITKAEMKQLILDLVQKLEDNELFIYWQASRGTGIRSHIYPDGMIANIWVMIWPKKLQDKNKTLRLITMEDTRKRHNHIKTINLLPAVQYANEAYRNAYDESVLYRDNFVTEGSISNVSILKDQVFYTAPCDENILPGIIRSYLLEACTYHHIPVKEEAFTLEDLKNADEIIISSSTRLCLRAHELNKEAVGGKDLETFTKLQDYIFDKFKEACE